MQTNTLTMLDAMDEAKTRRNPRGVFQKVPGKYSPWWIRYIDAQGRFRRRSRHKERSDRPLPQAENEALEGKKLPEKLRRAAVSFKDISKDALAYSKTDKRSYRDDEYRMSNSSTMTGPGSLIRSQDGTGAHRRRRSRNRPGDRSSASLHCFSMTYGWLSATEKYGEHGKAGAARARRRAHTILWMLKGGGVRTKKFGVAPKRAD